eukprot:193263_1
MMSYDIHNISTISTDTTRCKYNLSKSHIPGFNSIEDEYSKTNIKVWNGEVTDAIKNGFEWMPFSFDIINISQQTNCPLSVDILHIIYEYLTFGQLLSVTEKITQNLETHFSISNKLHIIMNVSDKKVNETSTSLKHNDTNSNHSIAYITPILCIKTFKARPKIILNAQNKLYNWEHSRQKSNESDMMHVDRMNRQRKIRNTELKPFVTNYYCYVNISDHLMDLFHIKQCNTWVKREDVYNGTKDWWGNPQMNMVSTRFGLFEYAKRIIDKDRYLYVKLCSYNGSYQSSTFEFAMCDNNGNVIQTQNILSDGYNDEHELEKELQELELLSQIDIDELEKELQELELLSLID